MGIALKKMGKWCGSSYS